MSKIIKKALLATVAVLLSTPAFSDSVLHIWSCKVNDGKTSQDLLDVNQKWLAAAKAIEGGESIELTIEVPLAANVADGSFNFVLSIADAAAWGEWQSNYVGSRAAEVDQEWSEVATCENSSLWSSYTVE